MSPDPTILSVTPSNPQTWNRYTYVLNNPSTNIDTNGKWSKGEHEAIINDVFNSMSDGDRTILKQASAEVDRDQSPDQSPEHGMARPGESAFQASQDAGQFVDTNINAAVAAQLSWEEQASSSDQEAVRETLNAPDALRFFGRALHTVTDVWSPEHVGFQTWNGYGDGTLIMGGPDGAQYVPSHNDHLAAKHVVKEWGSGWSPLLTGTAARHQAEESARMLWLRYQDELNEARKKRKKKEDHRNPTAPNSMANVSSHQNDN